MPIQTGEDEHGCFDLAEPERPEHVKTRHVGEVQVEKDQVVQEHASEIEAILAQLGRLHVNVLGPEHQLDAFCDRRIILNEKETHGSLLPKLAYDPLRFDN